MKRNNRNYTVVNMDDEVIIGTKPGSFTEVNIEEENTSDTVRGSFTEVNVEEESVSDIVRGSFTEVNEEDDNVQEAASGSFTEVNEEEDNVQEAASGSFTEVNEEEDNVQKAASGSFTEVNPEEKEKGAPKSKNRTVSAAGFAVDSRAQARYEERQAEYWKNKKSWLDTDWASNVYFQGQCLRKGQQFMGYTLTKYLVNAKDRMQKVGGESAAVFQAVKENIQVVIKITNRKDRELVDVIKEKVLTLGAKSNYIATYYDVGIKRFEVEGANKEYTYEIMEYCGEKSLEDFIYGEERVFSMEELERKLIPNMLDALELLGKERIAHCDIKPSNIMWNEQKQCYTLIDFGVAKPSDKINEFGIQAKGFTRDYVADELLADSKNIDKADYYSLGYVLFVALTGGYHPLWVIPSDTERTNSNGKVSKSLKNYVRECGEKSTFSMAFADIFDGLTDDYGSRYNATDVRNRLSNRAFRFNGKGYFPNEDELYEAMGESWSEGKEAVFKNTRFKEVLEAEENINRQRIGCLNTARDKYNRNNANADIVFAEFLLNVQNRPVLLYKGKRYSNMHEYAESFLKKLRAGGAAEEKALLKSGLIAVFYDRSENSTNNELMDVIRQCSGKNVTDAMIYEMLFRILPEEGFLYNGERFKSRKDLLSKAQSLLKRSYKEYLNFCYTLDKSTEYEGWKRCV